MSKKIFVGNLPQEATEDDLAALFGQVGEVLSANLVIDRQTGCSKCFGFVEMSDADADAAISELDGLELEGRVLMVNEAREQKERPGRKRVGSGGQRGRGRGRPGGVRGGRY